MPAGPLSAGKVHRIRTAKVRGRAIVRRAASRIPIPAILLREQSRALSRRNMREYITIMNLIGRSTITLDFWNLAKTAR